MTIGLEEGPLRIQACETLLKIDFMSHHARDEVLVSVFSIRLFFFFLSFFILFLFSFFFFFFSLSLENNF